LLNAAIEIEFCAREGKTDEYEDDGGVRGSFEVNVGSDCSNNAEE
jgi:hypothetical protein